MSTQLLFYETTEQVSSERHRDWSVKKGTDYSFAKQANAVPLTTVEFAKAAAEYAIVFTGTGDHVMPAVIPAPDTSICRGCSQQHATTSRACPGKARLPAHWSRTYCLGHVCCPGLATYCANYRPTAACVSNWGCWTNPRPRKLFLRNITLPMRAQMKMVKWLQLKKIW